MTTTEAAPKTNVDSATTLKMPLPNIFDPKLKAEEEDASATELVVLPDPVGHRMLIALPTMAERTAGGIIIPRPVNDRERAAAVIGKVLAQGPDCYKDTRRFPGGAWCKVGDTVLFNRYAGGRFKSKDIESEEMVEYRILNDDEITATIPVGARVEGL